MLTPLPECNKVEQMQAYGDDAVAKGAKVMNANAGAVATPHSSNSVVPGKQLPDIFHEEQF